MNMELLAPAGSPECLEPAVRCGADAVYLGASRFSARGNAANFDREALSAAVRYCHGRGVKVYLALNTLLRDDELEDALTLVREACALHVDALIIQDPGLIRMVRACAPELKLSASTQMSIHAPAGVALCRRLGMGRVVLSRELSKTELQELGNTCGDIELEAFAHGALCMSVSGQCYFSAMLGSRSGNRGLCAQPCRLPFAAPNGTGHDLSLKDLSLIGRMDELAGCGIGSAKIEGRMKRPEYVAAAVTACRNAMDGTPAPDGLHDALRAVFSRSGFTQGFFDGKRDRNMFGTRQKEDVEAASPAVLAQLHNLYRAERPRVPVKMIFTARTGKPCTLTIRDGVHSVTVAGDAPQTARSAPMTAQRITQQLSKLGGTPLYVAAPSDIVCRMDDGLVLPASALNRMRREACDLLMARRECADPISFDRTLAPAPLPAVETPSAPALRLHFYDPAEIPDTLPDNTELVYIPAHTPRDVRDALQDRGLPVGLWLPRGTFGTERGLRALLKDAAEDGIRDVWCGTLNTLAIAADEGLTAHGGFSLNAMNRRSFETLHELGAADTEVSVELTLPHMAKLRPPMPWGAVVYGRLPLMLTRCCPLRNGRDCARCDKHGALTDRKGVSFPVRCAGGCSEVLNSVPLCWTDRLREFPPMHFRSMRFTVENSVEIAEILRRTQLEKRPETQLTRGLYEKGVF
ncbi:MAG: U32 family peptidase [Clostridia bacterium]|nr:U32 family peptidase [Clostridia bacterium]